VKQDIRIAAVICHAPYGQVRQNIARMHFWVQKAGQQGASVICFPELNITGYATAPDTETSSVAIPGPATDAISHMARTHDILILAGALEAAPESRFAAHIAAFPDGGLGVYRKVHTAPVERGLFSPGDSAPVFHYQGLQFGIQLCYDAHFPELTTRMALDGADLIFIPHASPRGDPEAKLASWMRHLPARAFDNSLFIVACNQTGANGCGLHFPGAAVAIGPDGNVLNQATGDEQLMVTDLKAADIHRVRNHRMRYFLPHRRPDAYRL
jgi:predicted amidohydrolase